MAGIKLRIHPLFFAFGVFYALTGKVFIFLIYTLTALIHELGHLFQAERLGYTMKRITLMPYGAVIDGNLYGLKLKDETVLALGGPLLNLIVALMFTAIWWVFPEVYAFTDVVVTANTAIAVINLIPAYPLDGGRILFSLLALRFGEKTAGIWVKALGAVFALALTGLFVWSCFIGFNMSILMFAVFVFLGLFTKKRENNYIRLFNVSRARLDRGIQVKTYAVHKSAQIKKIINIVDADCMFEITVLDDTGRTVARFSHAGFLKIMERAGLYERIDDYIN